MATDFQDSRGNTWTLHLSFNIVRELKNKTEGTNIFDHQTIHRLGSDDLLLFDVVLWLCDDQIKKRELTDEEFATAIRGEGLGNAWSALIQEISDFCQPRVGKVLATQAELNSKLEAMTPQLLERMNQELNKISTGGDTLPGASEYSASMPDISALAKSLA